MVVTILPILSKVLPLPPLSFHSSTFSAVSSLPQECWTCSSVLLTLQSTCTCTEFLLPLSSPHMAGLFLRDTLKFTRWLILPPVCVVLELSEVFLLNLLPDSAMLLV